MGRDEIDELVRFFKTLGDPTRLTIVGLLAGGERSVDQLATLTGVRAPTVSHHLTKLRELALVDVRPEGTTRWYSLRTKALEDMRRRLLTRKDAAALVEDVPDDDRAVLRVFVSGGRLTKIPAGHRRRLVVLRWLAGKLDHSRTYTEKEINQILGRYHDDVAFLRREMVAFGLLRRDRGRYERGPSPRVERSSM